MIFPPATLDAIGPVWPDLKTAREEAARVSRGRDYVSVPIFCFQDPAARSDRIAFQYTLAWFIRDDTGQVVDLRAGLIEYVSALDPDPDAEETPHE